QDAAAERDMTVVMDVVTAIRNIRGEMRIAPGVTLTVTVKPGGEHAAALRETARLGEFFRPRPPPGRRAARRAPAPARPAARCAGDLRRARRCGRSGRRAGAPREGAEACRRHDGVSRGQAGAS